MVASSLQSIFWCKREPGRGQCPGFGLASEGHRAHLFGGRFSSPHFANGVDCSGYTHSVLPGLSRAEDPIIHLGNPGGVCRFSQAEIHPSIFTIIPCAHNSKWISNAAAPNHEVPQGQEKGFTNLVDTVCSNVDKIGGCRLEVRIRKNLGLSLRNGIQAGITSWLMLLGKDIHVKKVKVSDYRALCQARIGCSHGSKCVQGDARHRPHRCSDSCVLVCIGG